MREHRIYKIKYKEKWERLVIKYETEAGIDLNDQ
jgi:hypothetical protein